MRKIIILFLVFAIMPFVFADLETIVLKRTYYPSHKTQNPYHYIPFQVPINVTGLEINYSYDNVNNTIDIGIFDARGTSKEGFRGWSGGSRKNFTIWQTKATPGYLPGPIIVGTWNIILGLYKIDTKGVEITLEVSFKNSAPPKKPKTTPWDDSKVLLNKPGWYRGDLHMHTEHSDGNQSIADLVKIAQDKKLDFLVLSEHNTSSHHLEASLHVNNKVLLILGEEVTTVKGHANVCGVPYGEWIDFRILDDKSLEQTFERANSQGALFTINHPFAPCSGCYWDFEEYKCHSIEVWNGFWDITDYLAVKKWDMLLRQGKRISAIGASDSHKPQDPIGSPTTVVYAKNLSQKAILEAVKEGKCYITNYKGAIIDFSARNQNDTVGIGETLAIDKPQKIVLAVDLKNIQKGRLKIISKNGKVFEKKLGQINNRFEWDIAIKENTYFRVEVVDMWGNMLAMTNPIYVGY